MTPFDLRTERLVLSIPVAGEAAAIAAAVQDPEIPRWTTLPWPYGLADAAAFVSYAATRWHEGTELTWAIRSAGDVVGMIGLHRVDPGGEAEIGYWMARAARGRGILAEAGAAVIETAFTHPDLAVRRLQWRAIVGNVPSAASARAMGFRYEGTLRQALADPRGRHDGWIAGLLHDDDRTPQAWPVLAS